MKLILIIMQVTVYCKTWMRHFQHFNVIKEHKKNSEKYYAQ